MVFLRFSYGFLRFETSGKPEENQKKTKRKPKELKPKKTRRKENHRPSYYKLQGPKCHSLWVGKSGNTHSAQLFARESSGPYLDCAMCYMPHALLRIKSEDKKKTGALTPNQRGGALVYQTVHQPGFISLTHCGPESLPR